MKCVRPDFIPSIAYLCTQATKATKKNRLEEIKESAKLYERYHYGKIIIGDTSLKNCLTLIDVEHAAVHENICGVRLEVSRHLVGELFFHAKSGKQ